MAAFAHPEYDEALKEKLVAAAEENLELLLANCKVTDPKQALTTNQHDEPWILSSSGDGCEVYTSKEEGASLKRFLGRCRFENTRCEELMSFLYDLETRLTWDVNCSDLEKKNLFTWPAAEEKRPELQDHLLVMRCETNAVGPVSARDFVDVNYCKHHLLSSGDGGEVVCGAVSSVGGYTDKLTEIVRAELADVFKPTTAHVRGLTSAGSGWHIVQDRNADGSLGADCYVYYVVHSDLKGWLPTLVLNNTVGGTFAPFFEAVKKCRADRAAAAAASE